MDENNWYYKTKEGEEGPFTLGELKEKLQEGVIDPNTLIKHPSLSKWERLIEVDVFKIYSNDEPPLEERALHPEIEHSPKERKSARPWVRFWARIIDYSWFILLVSWVLSLVFSLQGVYRFFGIYTLPFVTFLFCFLEAFLLWAWGYTPGKWLLRVKVRTEAKQRLSFREGISRALSVWFLGFGAGIFLITLVTLIVANVKLSNNAITTWDKRGNYQVTHKKIGAIRIIIAIIFFFVIVYFYNLRFI